MYNYKKMTKLFGTLIEQIFILSLQKSLNKLIMFISHLYRSFVLWGGGGGGGGGG